MGSTVDQLRRELAEMRVAMDHQQARIEQLEAAAPEPSAAPRRSRRQMLRLAGATLAGAAAGAAGIAGSTTPVLAVSGDNLILGHSQTSSDANTADLATQLDYTGAASPGIGFLSQIGAAYTPTQAVYSAALGGWTTENHTPDGVYGYTAATNGAGVRGWAAGPNGIGVWGASGGLYGGEFLLTSTGKA